MSEAIWVALLTTTIPTLTTALTSYFTHRANSRNNAKQSIITWIMHDKLEYLMEKELPKHYERIHEEYETYHKNGGNGRITAEVEQYDKWIASIEEEMAKKRSE